MLSDKLELNSVRALGRLELTSWEHIPGWAEIQTLLGKTCESGPAQQWWQGVAVGPSGHSGLQVGARSLRKSRLRCREAWAWRKDWGHSRAPPSVNPGSVPFPGCVTPKEGPSTEAAEGSCPCTKWVLSSSREEPAVIPRDGHIPGIPCSD